MNRLFLALPLALAACAQPAPPPIIAYDVSYTGKWAPTESIRPEPRPAVTGQRIFPACDKWPDDCGSTFTPPADRTPIRGVGRPDVPAFDFTPTLPAPTPEAEPAPVPETEPQPEPEPESPVEQWVPA